MRTLDDALTAIQEKKHYHPACKIVLTSGETEYTLEGLWTGGRILKLEHNEEPWSMKAKAVLNNSDGYLTSLDLKGYTAVISWGIETTTGKLYSATSPLTVTYQQLDSSPGSLNCELSMIGMPDLLNLDTASYDFLPAATSTATLQDLIEDLLGATMIGFTHCTAVDYDFDGSAASYLTYKPKTSFFTRVGDTRLTVLKRLLSWSKCVARWGYDGHVHILLPTTTGTTYDSEYALPSGHAFFSKIYRDSLVLPNKVTVRSLTYEYGDEVLYWGSDTSAASYALVPKEQYIPMNIESDAEGTAIAEALIFQYELGAQMGGASVPMNCGSEVYDYIKVTDSRESDYRIGNIGSLTRTFNPYAKNGEDQYKLDFGLGDPPRLRSARVNAAAFADGGGAVSNYKSFNGLMWNIGGAVAAGDDITGHIAVPWNMTCYVIYLHAKTAPTSALVIDVLLDGVSICYYDTEESEYIYPTIETGETDGYALTEAALTSNGILAIDVLEGDCEDLNVCLRCTSSLWRP